MALAFHCLPLMIIVLSVALPPVSAQTACAKNQFLCDLGACIPSSALCNNVYDCFNNSYGDFSDETNCACTITWKSFDNTNTANGVPNAAINLANCRAACLAYAGCTGIDWNQDNKVGLQCWFSGSWNTGRNDGTQLNVVHEDLTIAGICTGECTDWVGFGNTNTGNGVKSTAASSTDCQNECLTYPGCTGIDWNPSNPSGQQCFFSGSWNTGRNDGTMLGVIHYDLVDNGKCGGGCSTSWVISLDTNVLNGRLNASIASASDCQASCLAYSGCTGVDWNPGNPVGQQCFYSGSWSTLRFNGTQPGVTHFDLVSNCPTAGGGCTPSWLTSLDTNVLSGILNASAASSTDCQAGCLGYSGCTGVDWNPGNPVGQQCFYSGSWSTIRNNGTQPGVFHFDLVNNCQGNTTLPPKVCLQLWSSLSNTNVLNGVANSASTIDGCKSQCLNTLSCTGFDWNPSNLVVKCWLSGPWNTLRRAGTQPGITHYDLVSGSCTTCTQWSAGRKCPVSLSTSQIFSLGGCQAACYANSACLGIGYNPSSSTCRVETNPDFFNGVIGPSNSTTDCSLYAITRLC